MDPEIIPACQPDLFAQLAATDPVQQRARRLFERGRVAAVNGNQADVEVAADASGAPLQLKGVPVVSGYVPRVGDWVSIRYEAGHSGAPWIAGPSMASEASQDSVGVGVFPAASSPPDAPAKSTVYFDETAASWRGWNGAAWVDLGGGGGGASLHNALPDLQGGVSGEYYHLSAAECAALIANMPFTAGRVFYADASGRLAGSASLVWDCANSRLGVGVSSPSARLHVGGDAYVDGTAGAQVRVRGVGSADSYAQVRDASASQGALDKRTASGVSYLDLNPLPADGASQAQVRLFRDTSTSGAKYVLVHPGDGSANQMVNLTVAPGAGGVYSTLTMFTYSGTAGEFPSFWLRRSRGSPASPAAVQSGDTLGAYRLVGYDGSSAIISGEITASATENWSASGRGADLLLLSTLAGTTSRVEGLRLRGAQALVRDGTASAPGLGFRDETGTGLYRYGSGVIGFTVGGTGQWLLSATALYPLADNSEDIGTSSLLPKDVYGYRHLAKDGTAASPSFTFAGETGTGFFRPASSSIGFTIGGVEQWRLTSAELYPVADNSETLGTSTLGVKALYLADASHSPSAEGEMRADSAAAAIEAYMGGMARQLAGRVHSITSRAQLSSSNGAASGNVATKTFASGSRVAGKAFAIRASGHVKLYAPGGGSSPGTATVELRFGSVSIVSQQYSAAAAGGPGGLCYWFGFHLEAWGTIRGTNQIMVGDARIHGSAGFNQPDDPFGTAGYNVGAPSQQTWMHRTDVVAPGIGNLTIAIYGTIANANTTNTSYIAVDEFSISDEVAH